MSDRLDGPAVAKTRIWKNLADRDSRAVKRRETGSNSLESLGISRPNRDFSMGYRP